MNCVDYLFGDRKTNDKLFVLGQKESISFIELEIQVGKVSSWLRNEMGHGQKILLLSSNSLFFIVAYLAIMKSGNTVVPLNPVIEKENFNYISEQVEATCGFIANNVLRRLEHNLEKVVNEMDLKEILLEPNNAYKSEADFDSEQLAQIIYTSGSTALPKGVMLSHKNIMANTNSIIEYLNLSDKDIMEVVLPFYYCYGLSLLHTHLRVKGSIVLNNNFMFIGSVLKDLSKYNCTGFAGVPSHFQVLLRKSDTFIKSDYPSLKYVTQAGGKLHPVFIKEFKEYFPNVEFVVMYGQTEATARLSYLPPEYLLSKLGSIGKGIPNVELQVVSLDGEQIKPGEVGEIIAKGDNVMLGYYLDEESTATTIKDSWLYTGDLATVDEDGFIYHTARKKEIIKVGGKRVSPKEIEEVLVSIQGVVDCTIEAIDDEVLGEAIKATLVVKELNNGLDESFVKAYCSERLASYKVPGYFEFVDRMNVSATGKKVKGGTYNEKAN